MVDLMGNDVKIIRARKKSDRVHYEDCRQRQFGENSDDEISDFISTAYRDWGIKKREAVCIISSKLFISKNVDMPSNDPDEISKIIDLQAGRYTPYSRDEIVIDYICMSNPGQHYTNVLLVIVNRKLVDRYVRIFDDADVLLSKIAISSESMAFHYQKLLPQGDVGGSFAGIHIDKDSSDLTIVDKEDMVFVRSIPVGAVHFKEDFDSAQKAFVSELGKSITSYQDHGVGQAVRGVIITGLIHVLGELEAKIRASVPLMSESSFPIKIIPYHKLFELSDQIKDQVSAVDGESFFSLLSGISSEASLRIDLLPKEIKLKRRFREGGKEVITMGIIIMTCLVMICTFLASKIYVKNNLIERLDGVSETVYQQARTLERSSTKTRVLRSLIEHRGKGLYVFDKITTLIGTNIYLASFSYDNEGNVHLVGTADTMSGVFGFVSQLEESGYFSSVVTNETKTRKDGGKEVADFDIEVKLVEAI